MSVGRRVENKSGKGDPERTYRVLCVNEKFKITKEIETHIRTHSIYYYVRYNAQNYWLYEWEGPEGRFAILIHDPAYDIH